MGLALLRKLKGEGYTTTSFSRKQYEVHEELGIPSIQGNLRNMKDVRDACRNQDIVFHTAAKVGVWGRKRDFYQTNVEGTRNVIEACKEIGVRAMVYTSSASVVFDGADLQGADESLGYPPKPLSWYTGSKAEAEKLVLDADSPELRTLSLRPHLIWGTGDTQLIPSILKRVDSGRMKRPGKKDFLVDTTYIDNCIDAHILALKVLDSEHLGGKAYFIGNNEPVPVWDFINGILSAHGYLPVTAAVPRSIAMALACIMEKIHQLPFVKSEPALTRFVIKELNTHHWFDLSRARELLGYEAKVGFEEGLGYLVNSEQCCANADTNI